MVVLAIHLLRRVLTPIQQVHSQNKWFISEQVTILPTDNIYLYAQSCRLAALFQIHQAPPALLSWLKWILLRFRHWNLA